MSGNLLLDALMAFLPVAAIAIVFGGVYWLFRKRKEDREKVKREAWIAERRSKRQAGGAPGVRTDSRDEARMEKNRTSDR